jgi:hypothetical protein
MSTLGGTTSSPSVSFTAQVTNKSSNVFLVATAVAGGSGGLSQLTIHEDTTMSGTPSYVYNVPFSVEGVCANGVIHCDPGTWNNCTNYVWTESNGLTLTPAAITQMKSCYCINSSCGYVLDVDNALKDLGGGMVAAVQSNNPSLTVTHVGQGSGTISYYGMMSGSVAENIINNPANSSLDISGPTDPSILYNPTSDASLMAAANTAAANKISDPNSIGYALSTTSGNSGYIANPITAPECQISARIAFTNGVPYETINDTCTGMNNTICTLSDERICDYNGGNCIQTMRYGNPTGYVALPSSQTIIGPDHVAWTFTVDGSTMSYLTASSSGNVSVAGNPVWWTIKHTYTCQSNTPVIDSTTNNSLSMSRNVTASSSLSGTTMTYTNPDGTTSSSSIYPGNTLPTGSPCALSCVVSSATQDTKIGATTTAAIEKNTVNTTGETYLACVDGVCPVGNGQTIVRDCQCLNDFAKALSTMQSMNNAAHDMTCSQN